MSRETSTLVGLILVLSLLFALCNILWYSKLDASKNDYEAQITVLKTANMGLEHAEARCTHSNEQLQIKIAEQESQLKIRSITQVPVLPVEDKKIEAFMRAKQLFLENIYSIQFPSNCSNVKYLYCQIDAAINSCGFGCQVHHFANCFAAALGTKRTVILNIPFDWKYGNCGSGWECYFKPLSSCVVPQSGLDVDKIPIYNERVDQDDQMVRLWFRQSERWRKWVPPDIESQLKQFHQYPSLWYIGQIVHFLLRPNADLEQGYNEMKQRIGFQSPIMGFHARGDDKIVENSIIYIDYYMRFIGNYSTIYLATDDKKNMEITEQYQNMTWLYVKGKDSRVSGIGIRHATGALENLLFDIYFLTECDFFLGSDGSQISRIVYELRQSRYLDGTPTAWSVHTIRADNSYSFNWYFI